MLELSIAVLSVVLIAASQLLFKGAMRKKREGSIVRFALQPGIIGGLALNGIAAVCWIFALRELEISYLYPLLSVNYLLVPLGARWVFGEAISRQRMAAITVICAGVFVCLLSK